jgi:cytochrome c oxidase subunit II
MRFGMLALLALLAGCGTHQQSMTNAAGTQAAVIERLWWTVFITLLVVFVLVVGFLGATLQRARGGTLAIQERQVISPERDRRMSRVILGLVIAVIIIELTFLVTSAYSTNVVRAPESKNPVEIHVVGHQWWWEFRYVSPYASQTLTTANELHIPVGVPVLIKTSTSDVIHSFWVPNIAGKQDLIPGYQNTFWIQAEREGVYRGQCTEFCGHQHAHMAMYVVAESMDKFEAWRNAQLLPVAEPASEAARRGQRVFLSAPCVTCHTVRGTDAGGKVGPELTHVASRSHIAAGTLPFNRENLHRWISDSQSVKPHNRMPRISLKPEELQDLISYLETLK